LAQTGVNGSSMVLFCIKIKNNPKIYPVEKERKNGEKKENEGKKTENGS
jgi:hypothetical protein